MSSPTKSQRATTWLCLVLALCIAVLPATGLMLCVGHDGHVAVSTGSSEALGCPCDHGQDEMQSPAGPQLAIATTEAEPVFGSSDTLPPVDEEHPCDDVDLDAPEAVRSIGLSQDLSTLLGKGITDWSTHLHLATLVPSALAALVSGNTIDSVDRHARTDRCGAFVPLPLDQLTNRRSVVLLI